MPQIQQFHTPTGGILSLWKITEKPGELLERLTMSDEEKREWNQISHPKRQREWLAARHLFHELGISEDIEYLKNGKPTLTEERKISVSHSHDLVGVLIHDKNEVGLDIQAPDPKLEKISSRFCNSEELKFAQSFHDPLTAFTIIWSAKEAVFKVFGENIHFAEQMFVRPFQLDQQKVHLDFNPKTGTAVHFQLPVLTVDKYYLVMAEHRVI